MGGKARRTHRDPIARLGGGACLLCLNPTLFSSSNILFYCKTNSFVQTKPNVAISQTVCVFKDVRARRYFVNMDDGRQQSSGEAGLKKRDWDLIPMQKASRRAEQMLARSNCSEMITYRSECALSSLGSICSV